MEYRTKTYIAGDWTGDKDLIEALYSWNNSNYRRLHFIDAHEVTQARDTSLYCSVKKSLNERLNLSKTFVLVVGANTIVLRKGGCQYCKYYDFFTTSCIKGHSVDYRSYIEYECEKADQAGMKIIVIYNAAAVLRYKCPSILSQKGRHINAYYKRADGNYYWNYEAITDAIMND